MNCTVLIVDDSKLARMAVAKTLAELRPGWRRVEATNFDEAVAIVQTSPVQMVLMDFNMPGRDGLALAAKLRELQPAMPLAVISANMQDEIVRRAHEVGAAFLPKPLRPAALESFLSSAEQHLPAQPS